ncbi:Alcohol dehydrogenase [Acidisarcina polymorpha]|uniref:alcohol dehydrogenase (NADP(+)) n=1 Tax=Acidisarcina polymorpha TaxID=2211140 RepID=A0A2Z5FWR4_9BACT|nr:NAD(P)-dependent alcohol dehydrogenase [Acidisarcina polymorpha]AXC10825.1 Alcohol dehydrogenase [Acidisarcina polymorpha]
MALIHGYATHAAGAELLPYKYEAGELKPTDIEVKVTHCGVCHSDLHLIDNDWGISQYPFIPGHEIVGTVSKVGTEAYEFEVGDRVGIGWQANSCGHCEWCRKGLENLCAKSQGTCVHRHGGFADSVSVNSRFVFPIPAALESEHVAPLLCAGITVYNPLREYQVNPTSRVGIIGIGGLGHIALQFARAFGAYVTGFSTSANKEQEALSLGAHQFVNTRDSKGLKSLVGHFDLILSTINADQDWTAYLHALRPTGTLVFVGAPPSPLTLPVAPLTSCQRKIAGSSGGSPWQIREMLDVAARHGIKAQTERFTFDKVNLALSKLRKNQIRYRAVLAS